MSDIRKLLDTINEMATTSGSVASVASPMGGVKSRKKDSIFYEGSTCKSCGCDPCKCDTAADNTVDGTKTPDAPKVSEFGLWKNSALIGQEQREKKKKKSVAEAKSRSPYLGDREYNALDDVQDQIAKMAHRHKDDEWSLADSEKLGKRLASRGRNHAEKLDELGNSLMPGGQRKLRLAQEEANPNRFDPRASRRHPGAVDVAEEHNGEYDDEAGMAYSSLHTLSRAAEELLDTIESDDNLPEWVQEKISNAEMMLSDVRDYLMSEKEQGIESKQDMAEARRKLSPPPKFTLYPSYHDWRQELMRRGDDNIDHLDNDYVDNYRVLFAVDRNRQVVGMYYHTANIGTFVPPDKGFSDMIYYADTDPHWPYKDDDGEEDLREGSAGWMLRQDPALAKKVRANTQGYKDLKKWAGKPIPKKDGEEGKTK
jgi:hypothetical protein